jgi:hypothetical protein
MTSRDELLRLAEWNEYMSAHERKHGIQRIAEQHERTAAAIRELLAQKPVGCVLPDGVGVYLDKPLQPDADLYAAPVPAVDLEAFKQKPFQFCDCDACEDAAQGAHLDKLGGKND